MNLQNTKKIQVSYSLLYNEPQQFPSLTVVLLVIILVESLVLFYH